MIREIRIRIALLASLTAALAGCGQIGTLADRYRAEQMLWWAQRAEKAANLGASKPDSTKLLEIREGYSKIGRSIRSPYIRGDSPAERTAGAELLRLIGTAELQSARLAVQANRPELAVEEMKRVASMAGSDSLLRRQCDFFRVGTLRQYHRTEEAIALMHEMLERYRPITPKRYQDEDPILAIPEAAVRLYRDVGNAEAAKAELAFAGNYYGDLLATTKDPIVEAQVRVRLMRVQLEQGNWDSAFESLARLEALVGRVPGLNSLMPELQFSKARLLAARHKDPNEAILLMDRVAVDFPESDFAARAIFEAGTLLEKQGKKAPALEHYRIVGMKYPETSVAPVAAFRRAMLEEQMGNWEDAKNLLESLPVRYPKSEAAVEAPMAVVRRYVRMGNKPGAEAALEKAIQTYRAMIARDTTSSYCPIYRWSLARCQVAQGNWAGSFETVDEMIRKDLGHPAVAQALLEAAGNANRHGQKDRARGYLEQFLKTYPKSPLAGDVRRELGELTQAEGAGISKKK